MREREQEGSETARLRARVAELEAQLAARPAIDAAVADNEIRLRMAMEAGQMAVWEYDVATAKLATSEQLFRLLGYPPGATPSAEDIRAGYPDEDWGRLGRVAEAALRRGENTVEAELRHRGPDGVLRTLLLRLELVQGPDRQVVTGRGVLMDITERKKAELGLRFMVNELNHRVKNTLAIVQSMARQTLRERADQPAAWQEFGERLVSLAAAHDLITEENWTGADLTALVARAMASAPAEQVCASGPNLRLSPKLALSLSMALYELLTNASKYGALSTPAGRVAIRWEQAADRLRLVWEETGGPTVEPPTRRGFGARLLQQALAADVDGKVELTFAPSGVCCRIEATFDAGDPGS